ncbi:MFS transporter [Streptomyces demainii]|uniref:MFS family permease n=1 Tax=Streptomyces demainii TaxID=588122 RepID=A0ABT9KMQ2_9ACTN|nr:MFS transporter [Streptomyces demainii]MDP9609700.1 MFS family permease [Streptomyces demainii]
MRSFSGVTDSSVAARLDRLPITRLHKRFAGVMALGNFFEIYELFLAGVLATTLKTTFALGGFELSLVLASAFVGAFVGAVVIGRLADRVGRRTAYMVTLTLYSAATLACALAPDLWTLVIFRFVAGVGLGGELPVTDSFLGDILPPARRGYYVAWAFTGAYLAVPAVGFLGLVLVDDAPLGVAGWRWMFAIGSLGALLTFLVRRGLPESPRWLESVGRTAEADAVTSRFEKAAEAEGWTPPVVFDEPERRDVAVEPVPIRAIFRRPLARRTVIMALLWLLAPVGFYGFGNLATLVLADKGFDLGTSLTYLTFSFIGYPLGSYLSMLIMERAERKWILSASLVGMAVFGLVYGNARSAARGHRFGFLLHRGGQRHVEFRPHLPAGTVPHECAHHRHWLAVLTEPTLDRGGPLLPGPPAGRLRSGGRLHRRRRGDAAGGRLDRLRRADHGIGAGIHLGSGRRRRRRAGRSRGPHIRRQSRHIPRRVHRPRHSRKHALTSVGPPGHRQERNTPDAGDPLEPHDSSRSQGAGSPGRTGAAPRGLHRAARSAPAHRCR